MSSAGNPDMEKHLKRKRQSYFLVVWKWTEHKSVFHLKCLHQIVVGAFQRPVESRVQLVWDTQEARETFKPQYGLLLAHM